MKNTIDLLARYTSYIFVPPSFTFLIFSYLGFLSEPSYESKILVVIHSFVFGLILPIIFFVHLRKKGIVNDVDATIKEERIQPYMFGVFLCLTGALSSYLLNFDSIIYYLWLIYFFNTLILILINKYWKISAHAIGASTPMGVLIYLYGVFGVVYIPVVILIGWSRIYLKKHTKAQVFVGSIFGFLLTLAQLYFFTYIIG